VNRRAAAQRRTQAGGYAAPVDRPRQRRATEQARSRPTVRAMLHGVEVRDEPDPGDGTVGFRAYASVTEHAYDMWDMFGPYTETIGAGAFGPTLAADPDVAFLLNHGGMTLARTRSGTLTLTEDDTGLLIDPRMDPANSVVRDVMSGVRRGDLSELSFAFRIIRGTWDPDYTAYRIEQVDLDRGDVSVVNYGANPDTFIVGDEPDPAELDVDALDDQQALALAGRLQQRSPRRSPAPTGGLSRAELDALTALAAPHPLARRVH
jgi:HK97 family phage prohead protease